MVHGRQENFGCALSFSLGQLLHILPTKWKHSVKSHYDNNNLTQWFQICYKCYTLMFGLDNSQYVNFKISTDLNYSTVDLILLNLLIIMN